MCHDKLKPTKAQIFSLLTNIFRVPLVAQHMQRLMI
jgi:hypothetical protein